MYLKTHRHRHMHTSVQGNLGFQTEGSASFRPTCSFCGSGHSMDGAWSTVAQHTVALCEVLPSEDRTDSSVGTDLPPPSFLPLPISHPSSKEGTISHHTQKSMEARSMGPSPESCCVPLLYGINTPHHSHT